MIQAKLIIGPIGDKYEQEADRVAAQVVEQIHGSASTHAKHGQFAQRQKEPGKKLQAKSILQYREEIDGREDSQDLASAINRARGGGQPLDAGLKQSMGQAMGADFSGVQVHTDGQADQLNQSIQAKAFTTGRDVFFRQGAYQPGSRGGQELIAHEMTHIMQQNGRAAQRVPSNSLPVQNSAVNQPLSIQRAPADPPAPVAPAATSATPAAPKETATPAPVNLSGKTWWDANQDKDPYKKSDQISDLESDFQTKVTEFKEALEAAGASISIDTTKRSKARAHIFHYAWNIANGKIKASAVPAMTGVDIVWDHGDDTKSKAGAQEILTAAAVAATEPSLTSNHIDGTAIDWTITWTDDLKIKQKDGTEKKIKGPDNGGDHNTELHAVGKSYGVIKGIFKKPDNPHWSSDGS